MELIYIPFDVQDVLNLVDKTAQFDINDIIRFHIIDVANNNDEYKNTKLYQFNSDIISQLPAIIGKYTSTIEDANIIGLYNDAEFELNAGFWDMFSQYKLYEKVHNETFSTLLNTKTEPYVLFEYRDIVIHYDKQCLDFIKSSNYMIEMILSCTFAAKQIHQNIYLPKSLTSEVKAELAEKYITSAEINPNYLQLIFNAKSTPDFRISDELRYSARKRYYEWWNIKKTTMGTFGYSVSVSFLSFPGQEIRFHQKKMNFYYEFSKEWIAENIDFPTLLNNFVFLFGYCDSKFRSNFVSLKHQISTFQALIGIHNKTDYFANDIFKINKITFSAEMAMYCHELKSNGIEIEEIFKWFFETYLTSEFAVNGFYYLQSTDKTSYLEKCLILSCTIESILKQYNMYCLNHYYSVTSNYYILLDRVFLVLYGHHR